ncbi:MAG: DUF3106 domain-containing protein [Candidatus Acidiferrum sp.]
MRVRLQLAGFLLALGVSTVLAAPSMAQRGRANLSAQEHRPPRIQEQRQQRQQERQQQRRAAKEAQREGRQNAGAGNARGNGGNRPNAEARANGDANRPPSAYTPPAAPQRRFSDLSPQQRQKVLDDYNRLSRMSPAQRQELQRRVEIWNHLTPAQRNHIRNDVLPKWRQMPLERRQAIRQRLHILQNMPEFARNERLNDPKFTEGMSDEDKATLRDLSHLHVGAPPDPPGE